MTRHRGDWTGAHLLLLGAIGGLVYIAARALHAMLTLAGELWEALSP